MQITQPSNENISAAAAQLAAGKLVAFPTETVYGLGAAALNPDAVRTLYQAKGRPSNHPVIVHLSSTDQLSQWAAHVPDLAYKLAEALWPGPLTLILPKAEHVPDYVTGGQPSVGLRIPQHPVALALLKAFGGGVAAPSANKFGRLSPTTAEDVAREFSGEVAMVLDGGACEVGIESTIVDLSRGAPRILRPGIITSGLIEQVIGQPVVGSGRDLQSTSDEPAHSAVEETRAPGGLPSHYAPRTPLYLVPASRLLPTLDELALAGKSACVLAFQPVSRRTHGWIVASRDPRQFAHELYGSLRQLDHIGADCILVEAVPAGAEWVAAADRLTRAAAGTSESSSVE